MKALRSPLARFCLLCTLILIPAAALRAETGLPQPPCAPGEGVFPAYAPVSETPRIGVWRDIELPAAIACNSRLQGRLSLVATVSGKFRHAGTLDDLAARAGAFSKTVGLIYWSATEEKWRKMISRASAVSGPGGNWREGEQWRSDFTAAEVRSGEVLWFMENDNRSTGENLYRLRAIESGPDRLVLEVVNESPITFIFFTLFGEHELLTLQSVERLEGDVWGFYSLSAVRGGEIDDFDKSLINRAAAFFRFLQGKPGDSEPPLAR